MRIKMKLVHALFVVAVMSAPVNAALTTTSWTTPGEHTRQNELTLCSKVNVIMCVSMQVKMTTGLCYLSLSAGPQGMNLKGKMFTLSQYGEGISFYPPYFSPTPWPSTPYYTTTDIPTSTSHPWTTAPTTRSKSTN